MNQPAFPEIFGQPRQSADTSLLAYDDIRADVKAMDLRMALKLADYLEIVKRDDATAGELAANLALPITSVRPRLTGALKAKALKKGPIRTSYVEAKHCRGYKLAVPRQAIERALVEAKATTQKYHETTVNTAVFDRQARGESVKVSAESKTGQRSGFPPSQPDLSDSRLVEQSTNRQGVGHFTPRVLPDTT